MSTILRSLKRLETEKESLHGGNERPLLTPLGTPQQEMRRAVKWAWLRTGLFRWAVVAVVAVIAAAGLFANTRPATQHHKIIPQAASTIHPAPRPAQPTPNPPPVVTRPQRVVPGHAPSLPPEVAPPAQIDARRTPPLPPEGAPRSVPKRFPRAQGDFNKLKEYVLSQQPGALPGENVPQPPAEEIAPQPPEEDDGPATVAPPSMDKPHPVTPRPNRHETLIEPEPRSTQPPQPSQEETGAFANAERMTDGRLNVQAIVWAPAPEDRMAVVNNRTVREGAAIEGFAIVGIGEEAIYVREGGGRLMKVFFGGP